MTCEQVRLSVFKEVEFYLYSRDFLDRWRKNGQTIGEISKRSLEESSIKARKICELQIALCGCKKMTDSGACFSVTSEKILKIYRPDIIQSRKLS